MVTDGVVLADPSLEERGFPPDVLMEDMIPTLKLVIRAVRSAPQAPPPTHRNPAPIAPQCQVKFIKITVVMPHKQLYDHYFGSMFMKIY